MSNPRSAAAAMLLCAAISGCAGAGSTFSARPKYAAVPPVVATDAPAGQPDGRHLPSAEDVLRRADEVRNPQLDYTTVVSVTSIKPDGAPKTATYEVYVKGRDRTLIKTLTPETDRGRLLLMRDHDLWLFLPKVSKPLRVSLRERLMGDVANGDLARTNLTGDYTPAFERTETMNGRSQHVLLLTATSGDVTYGRVRLWVDAETYHPAYAEFYAVSGRLLKTCSYERYQELAGRLRPTQLIMGDPINRDQRSVIEYDSMEMAELPEKYFTKDYMKKLTE